MIETRRKLATVEFELDCLKSAEALNGGLDRKERGRYIALVQERKTLKTLLGQACT